MNAVSIQIDATGDNKWFEVATGRIESLSATIRGAAAASFTFEGSIDGAGAIPLAIITLTADGQTDGISFTEPFRYPKVRVRRTDGGAGTPSASVFGGVV